MTYELFIEKFFNFESMFYLSTSVVSFLIFLILIVFQQAVLSREIWAKFLSLVFLVMSLQYFARFLGFLFDIKGVTIHFVMLGSFLNNIFSAATALALLYPRPSIRKGDIFKTFLPWWVWVLAITSGLIYYFGHQYAGAEPGFWYKFPDASISGAFLVWMGYALFLNINGGRLLPTSKAKSISITALVVLLSQVAYGVVNFLLAFYDMDDTQQVVLLVAVFPPKIILFAGGFVVLMQSATLTNSEGISKILSKYRDKRSELLVPGGIVDSLGKNLNAARVRLFYFRPGKGSLYQLYWQNGWMMGKFNEISIRQTCLTVREAIQTSEVCIYKKPAQGKNNPDGSDEEVIWAIPIIYHGGVIGCLSFAWNQKIRCTMPLLERLLHVANILAPAVHQSRQMLAIKTIEEHLRRIEIVQGVNILQEMTTIVHKVLGVPIFGMQINIGFFPNGAIQS